MDIMAMLHYRKDLSETERTVADYILAHPDEVLTMTIGDLSAATFCSASAVVRLCQKLGLDGFRSLRVELARSLEHSRLSGMEVNPDRPFVEGNSTADITAAIATLSKQAIDASRSTIKTGDIGRAARHILNARRVIYYAVGDSLVSAEMFATLLVKLGVLCFNGFEKADLGAVSHLLDSRDVALVITHSGSLVDTYGSALATIRGRGCRTVMITANPELEKRLAGTDCTIMLPQGESRSQRLATFYSQECIRYVLNCIYAEAFAVNYRENVEHLGAIESQLAQE